MLYICRVINKIQPQTDTNLEKQNHEALRVLGGPQGFFKSYFENPILTVPLSPTQACGNVRKLKAVVLK